MKHKTIVCGRNMLPTLKTSITCFLFPLSGLAFYVLYRADLSVDFERSKAFWNFLKKETMGYLDEALSYSNPSQSVETPSSGGGLRSIFISTLHLIIWTKNYILNNLLFAVIVVSFCNVKDSFCYQESSNALSFNTWFKFQPEWKIQLWICKLGWKEIIYGRLLWDEDRRCWWRNRWSFWSFWW